MTEAGFTANIKPMPSKLDNLIARHDRYLVRINRMLAAADRGAELPEDCKFHHDEIQSLDDACHDIVIELLDEMPSEGEWLPPGKYAFKHGYCKGGRFGYLRELRTGMTRSKALFESIKEHQKSGEVRMHTGDILAQVVVGPGASVENIVTHGDINQGTKIDLDKLAEELSQLRKELKAVADENDPASDVDIGKIAAAEAAAKNGDESKVRRNLKAVGKWVLETVIKIGLGPTIAELMNDNNGNSAV